MPCLSGPPKLFLGHQAWELAEAKTDEYVNTFREQLKQREEELINLEGVHSAVKAQHEARAAQLEAKIEKLEGQVRTSRSASACCISISRLHINRG